MITFRLFSIAATLCFFIFCPNFLASQCTTPSSQTAASPTSTGATLDWTENGTATLWDIEIQPSGTPATGTPTVSGVTKPYVWTGGSQATNYQFWVRSDCGGGSYSAWAGPVTFLTAFDNAAPSCVSLGILEGSCLTFPISVSGAPGNTLGTDVFLDKVEIIIHHSTLLYLDIYLQTPSGIQIPLSTGNGYLGNNYGGTCSSQTTAFAAWASTPVTAGVAPFIGNYLPEGSFTSFDGANPNGNWTLVVCENNNFTDGIVKYVRLHFTTCPRPYSLTAANPTPTGATFNWTEEGNATIWDIEVQPVGTPATGTPTVSGVTKPFTWTGGSQSTQYQYWVRSQCGGSTSNWTESLSFYTAINNAAPDCITFVAPPTGCSNTIPIHVSGAPGSTLGTDIFLDRVEFIIYHDYLSELDIYLETPSGIQIPLSTGNGGSGYNYGGVCPTQKTTLAQWATTPVTAGSAPFFGNYVPEGSFDAFNGANPNGNWRFYICDNDIFDLAHLKYVRLYFTPCRRPSDFTVSNPTVNGATFNWTEIGAATTWDLECQPVGTSPTGIPTVAGISAKPYTWTGGNQGTTYQAWVRSNCSGSNSEWTGPVTFRTYIDNAAPACLNISLPNGCDWFPIIVSGAPGTMLGTDVYLDKVEVIAHHAWVDELDIYLETPSNIQVELSTDNGGTGDNYGGNCSSQTTTFAHWASTAITAGSPPFIGTYIPEGNFASFNGANPNGIWELAVCDDGNFDFGSLKYVRLYFTACPRPTAIAATNLTANGATFNWTENGTATTWDIEFQPAGTPATGIPTVSGVSKPYTWTGGSQATSYQAWVRSSCGSGSEWAGPVTFQTLIDNANPVCVNFTLPAANACAWYPLAVSGAPGTTLGTDVFLDKVEVIVHHTWADELDIYLETPSNIQIELSTDNGGSGSNYGNTCPDETTTFAMWASTPVTAGSAPFIGTYRPEGNFTSFNGANPNGTWEIAICDDGPFDIGSLKYVRLHFASSLPVQLVSFTATPTDAWQVRLDWATESEQNSEWFIVERSANGKDFSEITRLRSAGHSMETRHYSTLDETPLPGINYYRLRQVDLDGSFNFSPVRSAEMTAGPPGDWWVYPNPSQGVFYVETFEEEGALSLISPDGKQVWTAKISNENKVATVSTTGLPAGLYWLQMRTARGIFTKKVMLE